MIKKKIDFDTYNEELIDKSIDIRDMIATISGGIILLLTTIKF